MKWCCFLFWFFYRLFLACLAHFNWCLSLYTNCIYFTMWKSYDLLWFWMHFILCSCFPPLRRENYLLVWINLIRHKYSKYPDLTYKEIYLAVYGGKGTKSEQALQRIETVERKEKEERISRRASRRENRQRGEECSSSSEDDEVSIAPERKTVGKEVIEEEEKECAKYLYVGQAVDSNADFGRQSLLEEGEGDDSDLENTNRWLANVPDVIKKKVKSRKEMNDIPVPQSDRSDTQSVSKWQRFKDYMPKFNRSASNEDNGNVMDSLSPNYQNTYDAPDEKSAKKREKRDRKALTKKVIARRKAELRILVEQEKRRKLTSDSIELILQILRMFASFAILVGNIRKTFIPAQFRYLRPGEHHYDKHYLLYFFRVTTFMDISMFWMNVLWAWCLQWHLCCRLGATRFFFWASLLGLITFFVVFLPMNYASNQLDISWCHFQKNSTLYKYQPAWNYYD